MTIEPLSPANLEAITLLMLELWPECTFTEEYENCQRMLHSGQETAFLLKNDGADPVAFITLSLRSDYVEGTSSSPVGYVEGLYVKPAFRQQGVARMLMTAGEGWCRARGCREIASDAELPNTGSQEFHRRVGFVEVNRIVCYRKDLE